MVSNNSYPFFAGTVSYNGATLQPGHPGSYDYFGDSSAKLAIGTWQHRKNSYIAGVARTGVSSDVKNYSAWQTGTDNAKVVFIPNYKDYGATQTTWIKNVQFYEEGCGVGSSGGGSGGSSSVICTDSDGGLNYSNQGRVTGNIGSGWPNGVQIYEDSCVNATILVERYCTQNYTNFTATYDCSKEGKMCSNGACIISAPPVSSKKFVFEAEGKNVYAYFGENRMPLLYAKADLRGYQGLGQDEDEQLATISNENDKTITYDERENGAPKDGLFVLSALDSNKKMKSYVLSAKVEEKNGKNRTSITNELTGQVVCADKIAGEYCYIEQASIKIESVSKTSLNRQVKFSTASGQGTFDKVYDSYGNYIILSEVNYQIASSSWWDMVLKVYASSAAKVIVALYQVSWDGTSGSAMDITLRANSCPSLTNEVVYPRPNMVEGEINYSLSWQNSYRGEWWMGYAVEEPPYSSGGSGEIRENYTQYSTGWYTERADNDNNYYYVTKNVYVFDNQKINLTGVFDNFVSNRICNVENSYNGNSRTYQYICNWDVLYQNSDPEDDWKSVSVLWFNGNVLVEENFGTSKSQRDKEEILARGQKKVLDFANSLENNQFESVDWSELSVSYPLRDALDSDLRKCVSKVPAKLNAEGQECSPYWQCKTEPIICPEYGTQKKVCVDLSCNSQPVETEVQCSPGICSGCYVPRVYSWMYSDSKRSNLDNICLPYGTRFANKQGDLDKVQEGTDIDGQTGKVEVNISVINSQSAYFYLANPYNVDESVFDQIIYVGGEYTVKVGDQKISFRVSRIVPGTNGEKGFVEMVFIVAFDSYCDIDGQIKEQKVKDYDGSWAQCQNNYECKSNFCSSGECIEIQDMLNKSSKFKSLGVRIMCRLAHMFGEDNYKSCVVKYMN